MPLKITSNKSEAFNGVFITKEVIVDMVQGFVDVTYKKTNANPPRKVTHDNDSHAVYYSKSEIDQLFADNGCTPANNAQYGLRIYMGFHKDDDLQNRAMPGRPKGGAQGVPNYIGQHTVILVCTKDKADLLNDGDSVSIFQLGGAGMEEGEICPPPSCGSIDVSLNP